MITGRRRSVIFFTVFGICLIAIAVALNVSWVDLNWRMGVLAILGVIFFLLIIAGMVLFTIFLVREIRRNEQQDSFLNAVTHELGHFLGLDHSQINVDVFNQTAGDCKLDTLAGLPLMFPFAYCQSRKSAGLGILAPDDIAWISALYPSDATTVFGKISGQVQFSDSISGFQGANVIARQVDNPSTTADESRRIAVSAVSGYLFTANPGQTVTATYGVPAGKR
jgi:hypothetical protein